MADFSVRSDSVDVEQIMEQIRARIREKRGVDYTEQQIRELAAVKLEKFLDPRGLRSDLLDQFKRLQPEYEPPIVPSFTFEDTTMYETHRGLLRKIRALLNPLLKLFFNPNAIIAALHTQAAINQVNLEREVSREKQRRDREGLYFEVLHNLVVEVTRLGIETKNLKMRVESVSSRLEFNERRARALESVVVYRPSSDSGTVEVPPTTTVPPPAAAATATVPQPGAAPEGPGQKSRRRRRRRGRRSGPPAAQILGAAPPLGGPVPGNRSSAAPGDGSPAAAGGSSGPASDVELPERGEEADGDTSTADGGSSDER